MKQSLKIERNTIILFFHATWIVYHMQNKLRLLNAVRSYVRTVFTVSKHGENIIKYY